MGTVALFDEGYFLVTQDDLLVQVNYTTWGWVHIGLGIIAIVTGFGIMLAQLWARVIAIIIAVVSLFSNLAFFAATPLWSLSIIALDVLVIFALIVHGAEGEEAAYDG
jgi:hypothetical protein